MMSDLGVFLIIFFISFVVVPLVLIGFKAMFGIAETWNEINKIKQQLMDMEREIVVSTIENCKANNFTDIVPINSDYLANCTRIKEELEEFCKKHGSVKFFTFVVDCKEILK